MKHRLHSYQKARSYFLYRNYTNASRTEVNRNEALRTTHGDDAVVIAEAPAEAPLPIAATFGVHLIRAEPFLSISRRDYFLDAIEVTLARAEEDAGLEFAGP